MSPSTYSACRGRSDGVRIGGLDPCACACACGNSKESSVKAPHRSYLFVPGNRPERFQKALSSGADAVIIDLEDAVPPDQKDSARLQVAGWLAIGKPVVIRINAADTRWFAQDVALLRCPGVEAVMLPKTERAQDLALLGGLLPIIALVETAIGIDRLGEIAAAPCVQRLAFGAIDFQLDMNMQASYEELVYFRSQIVLASRLARLQAPIDSPSLVIDVPAEVAIEAQSARRLGFGGKLCIHPKQVEGVNISFSPTEAEVAWAKQVLAVAGSNEGGAMALEGKMIDKPVMLRAEAILRERRHR